MHPTLFLAARDGNVESLLQLLHEDPLLLERTTFATITDNPLHISAMLGHIDFVKELLKHKRDPNSFMKELNQHGFSAIHLASTNGHVDVVRELLSTNRLKGKDGMTALHCAAIKGRVEVINVLLETSNLTSILADITARGETALHLAVKNYQIEAFSVLLKRVSDNDMVEILNCKDDLGNTPLHLAAVRRNREAMELLLDCNKNGIVVQTNVKNKRGLTPLDLLPLLPSDSSMDTDLERLLMNHHANRGGHDLSDAQNHPYPPVVAAAAASPNQRRIYDLGASPNYFDFNSLHTNSRQNLLMNHGHDAQNHTNQSRIYDFCPDLKYFKFNPDKSSPDTVRQNLLVVFGLFANATYQAALSPPEFKNRVGITLFLVFNALGFFISLQAIILVLTPSYPLFLETLAAYLAMIATFSVSIATIPRPGWVQWISIVLASTLSISIPLFIHLYRKCRATPRTSETLETYDQRHIRLSPLPYYQRRGNA